jgi:L-2-hydroxyglutarate oxidase LhgO
MEILAIFIGAGVVGHAIGIALQRRERRRRQSGKR